MIRGIIAFITVIFFLYLGIVEIINIYKYLDKYKSDEEYYKILDKSKK